MFKVYDSNFKEVKIPVDSLGFGSRALEINVGPVIYENVYSQSRRTDTLVKRYPKDRHPGRLFSGTVGERLFHPLCRWHHRHPGAGQRVRPDPASGSGEAGTVPPLLGRAGG